MIAHYLCKALSVALFAVVVLLLVPQTCNYMIQLAVRLLFAYREIQVGVW